MQLFRVRMVPPRHVQVEVGILHDLLSDLVGRWLVLRVLSLLMNFHSNFIPDLAFIYNRTPYVLIAQVFPISFYIPSNSHPSL